MCGPERAGCVCPRLALMTNVLCPLQKEQGLKVWGLLDVALKELLWIEFWGKIGSLDVPGQAGQGWSSLGQ